MNKDATSPAFCKKREFIIPAVFIIIATSSLLVLKNHQNIDPTKSELVTDSASQSHLTVSSGPSHNNLSIGKSETQPTLVSGQMSVDNLLENINLLRAGKGLGVLHPNQSLIKAAETIASNRAIGTDNSLFSQLIKYSGYKYTIVASSILTSCNDLTCALSSLEYSDTDKGIYNSVFKDIGIAVSSNQNYAVIIWGQPYQQIASNYSGGSSSSNNSISGSTFVLPDWSYKYTPPPDIDYSRPSPTLDTGTTAPTNSCTSVTSSEPNKYYYKCGYGQRATGVNCKAIAPYDYTSNLWSCNK